MSTDPSSPDFDPLLALYSEEGAIPKDGIKVYDNIAVFEGSLRKQELSQSAEHQPGLSKQSKKSFSQKKKVLDEAKNRDVEKLKEMMEMRRRMDLGKNPDGVEEEVKGKGNPYKPKPKKNLLTSMEKLSKGPYSILHCIVREHARCNVYVRDFCGLRGVCTGYVVAYDRYINLAMIDIDETFRKPPLGKVADHQKELSVSMLEDAVRSMKLGKGRVKVMSSRSRSQRHASAQSLPEHNNGSDRSRKSSVKIVGTGVFDGEVFHSETPQLYHRHIDQLLVRGDSIVLVAVKKYKGAGERSGMADGHRIGDGIDTLK